MFERAGAIKEAVSGKGAGLIKRLRDSVKFERDSLMLITLVFVFISSMGVIWFLNSGTKKVNEASAQVEEVGGGQSISGGSQTYVVEPKKLDVQVRANGVVKAVKTITLTTAIAGKVASVSFVPGSKTTTEAIVAKLDKTVLTKKADQAKARYELALAEVDKLRQANPPVKETDINLAQMRADISKGDFELAQADASNTDIKIPAAGIVDTLNISQGQIVYANQVIGTLIDQNDYVIEAWLPPTDANSTKVDATATVDFISRPNEKFTARIVSIGMAANNASPPPGAGSIPMLLKLSTDGPPLDFLRTGLFGANVLIAGSKTVISVPKTAVIDQAGKKMVYIVTTDKRLIGREVKLGSSNNSDIEILDGLMGGETIAVNELSAFKTAK